MFEQNDLLTKTLANRAQIFANTNLEVNYRNLYISLMTFLKKGFWECILELSH
jgi:hypothetical protein